MRRQSWLVAGGIWLAVVAAVAIATWSVIDSAGRDVLADPAGGGLAPAPGASSVAPMPTEPSVRVRASGSPKPSPRSGGSQGPRALASLVAPFSPVATPSGGATSPSASSAPQPGRSSAPTSQSRTWQGPAGTVTTRCSGPRISLASASPRDGWGMEIDKRGPQEVEVKFDRGETDSEDSDGSEGGERETEVRARCRGGAPSYDVRS